ncbi:MULTISPECIES: hypothetical protein [Bacillus cereus group]|uniref:hypothetical protein n=1 Tax=Bacillus cereus group TaxID=86661 RepID=UPI0018DE9B98|nr:MULTISPECIES: hypothetical protein [Bacillus cereus group]MBJ8123874.1 hypothetical protein [Bacillus cereus]
MTQDSLQSKVYPLGNRYIGRYNTTTGLLCWLDNGLDVLYITYRGEDNNNERRKTNEQTNKEKKQAINE